LEEDDTTTEDDDSSCDHDDSGEKKEPPKKRMKRTTKKTATNSTTTVRTPLRDIGNKKPSSPPTSSIKEITSNMWEANKDDWRATCALDY
jgi:hypothetical protein